MLAERPLTEPCRHLFVSTFLSTFLLSTFLLLPTPVLAEAKIAFVDLGRAFDDYEKTKRLDKQLEERSGAKQAERDKMVSEIRKMKDELELMSDRGREDRQTAIDERIRSLQEFDRQTREALKRERDELVRDLLKEIEQGIQEYAKQQGYDFVLSDRAILYANESTDITDEVIAVLNTRDVTDRGTR